MAISAGESMPPDNEKAIGTSARSRSSTERVSRAFVPATASS